MTNFMKMLFFQWKLKIHQNKLLELSLLTTLMQEFVVILQSFLQKKYKIGTECERKFIVENGAYIDSGKNKAKFQVR